MFFGLFRSKPKMVKVKKTKAQKPKLKKKTIAIKTKKQAVNKTGRTKKTLKPKLATPQLIGKVTHYFPHVRAGVILVSKGTITAGDTLYIKGHTTDLKQKVKSIQINNTAIKEAKPGQEIGILVKSRVRGNDLVYKL